jgi:long-chain fatty acid transport protein
MTFGDMFAAPPPGGFGYTELTAGAAMKELTAFGFGGKIGLAWKVNERVSFGLSYTSPTTLTYTGGTARMDMTAQLNDAFGRAVEGLLMQNPGMTPEEAQMQVMQMFTNLGVDLSLGAIDNYDLEVKLKLPQSIGFGAAFNFYDNVRVAMDVEWINWQNAFTTMSLSMSGGTNPNINRLLGSSGDLSLEFPLQWRDAFMARLGVEVDVTSGFTLRAGGAFGTNPVPSTTLFAVFPAIVENHVTLGASVKVFAPLTLHAALEHAFNNPEKAAATSLIAREYDNSINQLKENVIHVSLTWAL